jgi:hypothetical protein
MCYGQLKDLFFMSDPYANDENIGEIYHVDIIETQQDQKPGKAEDHRVVVLWLCIMN